MTQYPCQEKSIKKARLIENEKIISLLKNKFKPLQQHKSDSIFPFIKSKSVHVGKKQGQYQSRKREIIYDIKINVPQSMHESSHPLVNKANQYLQIFRRNKQVSLDYKRKPGVDMQKYLNLLEDTKKRDKQNEQYLKSKRQIQIFSQCQPYFKDQIEMNQKQQKQNIYSYEYSSLLNAKIRQKLNHKRILALYK